MHVSAFKQSNYLTRNDVGKGILVTIKSIVQENLSKQGEPEELKWAMYFAEVEKPLIINMTNANLIAQIANSEETDSWIGHKIVLYDDPTVSFAGRLVGGIRARAPRGQAAAASKPIFNAPAPAAEPPDETSDSPF